MIYDGQGMGDILKVTSITRPVMPDIDLDTEALPGRDGLTLRRAGLKGRQIKTEVALVRRVAGSSRQAAAMEKARRELGRRLWRSEPCELILHDAPDIADMAVLSDAGEIERLAWLGTATLTWQCVDAASYGETRAETVPEGGAYYANVVGTYRTAPVVQVVCDGPFTVLFDGVPFEVTGSPSPVCGIDAEKGEVTCDGAAVRYALTSDFPVWEPGVHKVECDLPYAIRWKERWL